MSQITPYVAPEKSMREFTFTSIGLGVLLALVMCAANTYLGLYAGMTVSASIPAAVISMGILRGIFKRGTILENNIVQTTASAGQSVAAGIIFTMPAMVIAGVWQDFDYWTVTLVAAGGGILGVLFMVPLRKMLIAGGNKELTYPEGLACAEVLKAGDSGTHGIKKVFLALSLGGLFKILGSGVALFKGTLSAAFSVTSSIFAVGMDISPALLAVGYIVGLNVGALCLFGGCIGWLITIPILSAIHPAPAGMDIADHAAKLWVENVRYIGVGAMIVAGLWSLWSIRKGIFSSVAEVVGMLKNKVANITTLRTERDIPAKQLVALIIPLCILIFCIYHHLTDSLGHSITATIIMIVAGFLFVAVSSYICGLLGSSNNPVSGITICTVLFTGLVMVIFGLKGPAAIIATLGIAGVVCCASCTAGDVSQDLKTGQVVGGTPKLQQWAMIIGAGSASLLLAPVLTLLHRSYGIGTGAPGALTAPQASLFAKIADAMFSETANLPWHMVLIGVAIAVVLIIVNECLKKSKCSFRTYVMPVAVGIYLPFSLSVPICLGGIIYELTTRALKKKNQDTAAGTQRGILFSSGLIAGESIAGILVAIPIAAGHQLPLALFGEGGNGIMNFATVLGLAAIIYLLVRTVVGKTKTE